MITLFDSGGGRTGWIKNFGKSQKEFDELGIAASTARISAIDCFEYASREGLHLHGGMGYTWELDCHLYLKRSRDLSLRLRSSRYWKEKLVALTLEAANKPETVPTWLANA